MKLITLLSAAALVGLGVSILDLSLSVQSLGLFLATASVLFLLGVVRDYAPRRPYWQPAAEPAVHFPRRPVQQLAA
ncbi:MAG: hypothetical protein JWM88_992 [Verrucomicrobia bacterium]|nr:hypothetical protein [Verrucomicrobiota bacterium]